MSPEHGTTLTPPLWPSIRSAIRGTAEAAGHVIRRAAAAEGDRRSSLALIPKPYADRHETILLEEAECIFIERPSVQGDQGYLQRSRMLHGSIQKRSADPLSACARSDTDLVDVDQFMCELSRRLRAVDNFSHQVAIWAALIEGEEGSRTHASAFKAFTDAVQIPRIPWQGRTHVPDGHSGEVG